MLRIHTTRLELVSATPHVARSEAAAAHGWYAPLDVVPPPAWPPPGNDRASQSWLAGRIARDADRPGWWLWYVLRRSDAHLGRRELIGNAGFKGVPDDRGTV